MIGAAGREDQEASLALSTSWSPLRLGGFPAAGSWPNRMTLRSVPVKAGQGGRPGPFGSPVSAKFVR